MFIINGFLPPKYINWSKTLMAFPLPIDTDNIDNWFPWWCLKGNVSIGRLIFLFLTIICHILQKTLSVTHFHCEYFKSFRMKSTWEIIEFTWTFFYQGRHSDLLGKEATWWIWISSLPSVRISEGSFY